MQARGTYAAIGQKIQIGANRVYELRDRHWDVNGIPLVRSIEHRAGGAPVAGRRFGTASSARPVWLPPPERNTSYSIRRAFLGKSSVKSDQTQSRAIVRAPFGAPPRGLPASRGTTVRPNGALLCRDHTRPTLLQSETRRAISVRPHKGFGAE